MSALAKTDILLESHWPSMLDEWTKNREHSPTSRWRCCGFSATWKTTTVKRKKTTVKRKKRKKIVLLTPEEWAGYEQRLESLLRTYERLKIELAAGKRPPPEADLRSTG
jgi:hypothetical protein